MAGLFLTVLETSITTSLAALLFILCSAVINRRYGAKWKCRIWLLLALRLLVPFGTEDVRSAADFLSGIVAGEAGSGETGADLSGADDIAPRRVVIELPSQVRGNVGVQAGRDGAGITWLELAALLWAMGGAAFILFHLSVYLHYRRQIEKKGKYVRDGTVLWQMSRLRKELGIKCGVPVKEYAGTASPMIAGFVKPVLVLPPEQYGEVELYFILKHELIHLKRRDVWFKLLLMLANAVHWFNPLIWLMQREAVIDMELACDEQVVQGEEYPVRRAYTETLLSTLHGQKDRKTTLSTQFYGGKAIMKKRFRNILRMTKKKNGILIMAGAVLLAAGMGAMVGCSVAEDEPKQNNMAVGIMEEGSKAPDVVKEKARELVNVWYLAAREEFTDYHYINWRISSLENCYTYGDFEAMTLEIYRMDYQFLSDTPENVLLAGGMEMTQEGWVTPGYADSTFLVFRQEGAELSFLTDLFENDCAPGDEIFTDDLRGALEREGLVPGSGNEAENVTGDMTADVEADMIESGNDMAADTAILMVPREGEMEEEPATLFRGEGYSIYLTDHEWQQNGEDVWQAVLEGQAVLNGQVTFRVEHPDERSLEQVETELAGQGYERMDEPGDEAGFEADFVSGRQSESSEWFRVEEDMLYKVTLKTAGEDVWKIFCSLPLEAEEGWGQTMRVMAASFAADAI